MASTACFIPLYISPVFPESLASGILGQGDSQYPQRNTARPKLEKNLAPHLNNQFHIIVVCFVRVCTRQFACTIRNDGTLIDLKMKMLPFSVAVEHCQGFLREMLRAEAFCSYRRRRMQLVLICQAVAGLE